MPINYARKLTGKNRNPEGNRQLGYSLAFVAGAINAGGFLAVHQYTSHMTGILSGVADDVAGGAFTLALAGLSAVAAFICGALCSALIVNYSRRRGLQSEYALPLLLEAVLLLVFGVMGARLARIDEGLVSVTVLLLCFIMGLQNAVITKLSKAEIRTTHVTGIVTDIGIELGRILYSKIAGGRDEQQVMPNRPRLKMLTLLVLAFFCGGIAGVLGFRFFGYVATVPLAIGLVLLAAAPAVDDTLSIIARWRRS